MSKEELASHITAERVEQELACSRKFLHGQFYVGEIGARVKAWLAYKEDNLNLQLAIQTLGLKRIKQHRCSCGGFYFELLSSQ